MTLATSSARLVPIFQPQTNPRVNGKIQSTQFHLRRKGKLSTKNTIQPKSPSHPRVRAKRDTFSPCSLTFNSAVWKVGLTPWLEAQENGGTAKSLCVFLLVSELGKSLPPYTEMAWAPEVFFLIFCKFIFDAVFIAEHSALRNDDLGFLQLQLWRESRSMASFFGRLPLICLSL